jgi:hypothetical protein
VTTSIDIGPAPAGTITAIKSIDDLDELIASAECSCSAGDNNPC